MADQNRIERGVREVLESNLGHERNEIKATSDIKTDLGADSLDQTEIIMDLEDKFDISINEAKMIEWARKRREAAKETCEKSDIFDPDSPLKTVQDIVDFLSEEYPELLDEPPAAATLA
jgi:acyl carrier protein